jgi:glutathione peroxidase
MSFSAVATLTLALCVLPTHFSTYYRKLIMPIPNSAFDFEAQDVRGKNVALKQYAGSVLLIVNTASSCGFTPQYKGLQELHDTYESQGLVVLGFPCNQFGGQESGSEAEIASFCEMNFGVSTSIKWNFTKFLVGKDGQVIKRYAPQDTPQSLAKDIEAALR